jgi:hypothetical protein
LSLSYFADEKHGTIESQGTWRHVATKSGWETDMRGGCGEGEGLTWTLKNFKQQEVGTVKGVVVDDPR